MLVIGGGGTGHCPCFLFSILLNRLCITLFSSLDAHRYVRPFRGHHHRHHHHHQAANSIKTLSVSTITQGQNQQNVSSGNPGAFPSAQQGAPPSAAAFSITTSHSHSAAIASIATPAVAPAAAAPAEDQEEKKIEILTALTTSPEAEALLGGLVETKETSGIDITDTPARAEDQAGEEAASAPKPKSQKKGKSKGKGKDKGKGEGKADTQEF